MLDFVAATLSSDCIACTTLPFRPMTLPLSLSATFRFMTRWSSRHCDVTWMASFSSTIMPAMYLIISRIVDASSGWSFCAGASELVSEIGCCCGVSVIFVYLFWCVYLLIAIQFYCSCWCGIAVFHGGLNMEWIGIDGVIGWVWVVELLGAGTGCHTGGHSRFM